MKISNEQVHCLNAICDDYEAIGDITNEVVSETGSDLSSTKVESLLNNLIELGLVEKYIYDIDAGSYVIEHGISESSTSPWFYITNKGRVVLDKNWKE